MRGSAECSGRLLVSCLFPVRSFLTKCLHYKNTCWLWVNLGESPRLLSFGLLVNQLLIPCRFMSRLRLFRDNREIPLIDLHSWKREMIRVFLPGTLIPMYLYYDVECCCCLYAMVPLVWLLNGRGLSLSYSNNI